MDTTSAVLLPTNGRLIGGGRSGLEKYGSVWLPRLFIHLRCLKWFEYNKRVGTQLVCRGADGVGNHYVDIERAPWRRWVRSSAVASGVVLTVGSGAEAAGLPHGTDASPVHCGVALSQW